MNSFKPSFLILSNDLQNHDLYETILRAEGFEDIYTASLENLKAENLKGDIHLIDISTNYEVQEVEKLFCSYEKEEIILISPFAKEKFDSLSFKYLHITKPINFKKFTSILKATSTRIVKEKFLEQTQDLLNDVVEESPIRMAIYTLQERLVYANKEYLQASEVLDFEYEHYFSDITKCKIDFQEVLHQLSTKKSFTQEREEYSKWYKSRFYYIKKGNYVVHLCSDITSMKNELESLNREALFFKHTNEGVLITDDSGIILSVNNAFCKITGYTKDEAIGKSTGILSSGMHTKDFYENMWDTLKHHNIWQGEIWNRRKNGEVYPEWLSISAAIDPKTKVKTYLALFTDISSIKETDKKLHFYANHDHLTGLLNRVQFENMLARAIKSAHRHGKKFALMFIDIDHFKQVNDTYGHNIGDLLLKKVAGMFQNTLRNQDLIARIGGDEFNILIEDINNETDVMLIANKLNSIMREPIVLDGHSCFISLSIGVSIYPTHGGDTATLGKNADAAMYEVKKRGRDGAILYDENFTYQLLRKVHLQNDLKKALLNEDITVHFQPVIDLRTNKINRAEALVRWKHPKKGFISPEEFIPIAEQHGMILELGKQVMKICFEFMPLILEEIDDFGLAINISARELFEENYIASFFELVDDFVVDLKHIELEITETHVMRNHAEAIEKFKLLKAKGVSLAIDDFGTGYSSLSYLKNFPIDKLKVDKSFVLNCLHDKGDRAIVESVIKLAKTFSLEVQAEGVETKEHVDILKELDCEYLQGYYFAKAMDAKSFLVFAKEFNEVKNIE